MTEVPHRSELLPFPEADTDQAKFAVVQKFMLGLIEDTPGNPLWTTMKLASISYDNEHKCAVAQFVQRTDEEIDGRSAFECGPDHAENALLVMIGRKSGSHEYRIVVGIKGDVENAIRMPDVCSCGVSRFISHAVVGVITKRIMDGIAKEYAEKLGLPPEAVRMVGVDGPEEVAAVKEAAGPTATVIDLTAYKSRAEMDKAVESVVIKKAADPEQVNAKAAHVVSGTDSLN